MIRITGIGDHDRPDCLITMTGIHSAVWRVLSMAANNPHLALRMTPIAMQQLYDKIPTFTCRKGCGDCCGLVPWGPEEFSRVADRLPPRHIRDVVVPIRADGSDTCPFFDDGCAVYEDRPFMCRLFGAPGDGRLKCPHGCQPAEGKVMTKEETWQLTGRYDEVRYASGGHQSSST